MDSDVDACRGSVHLGQQALRPLLNLEHFCFSRIDRAQQQLEIATHLFRYNNYLTDNVYFCYCFAKENKPVWIPTSFILYQGFVETQNLLFVC